MCTRTNTPPALACTIGDLKRGQQYHDQYGETWMVLGLDYSAIFDPDPPVGEDRSVLVANLGNRRGGTTNDFGFNDDEYVGIVTPVYARTKLGYDHKGRLYTSTALNGWNCDPDPIPADQQPDNLGFDATGSPIADDQIVTLPDDDEDPEDYLVG